MSDLDRIEARFMRDSLGNPIDVKLDQQTVRWLVGVARAAQALEGFDLRASEWVYLDSGPVRAISPEDCQAIAEAMDALRAALASPEART